MAALAARRSYNGAVRQSYGHLLAEDYRLAPRMDHLPPMGW